MFFDLKPKACHQAHNNIQEDFLLDNQDDVQKDYINPISFFELQQTVLSLQDFPAFFLYLHYLDCQ